jgi:tRNA splicing endonuclease
MRDLSLCLLNAHGGVIRKTIDVGCDLRVYTKQPTVFVITALYLIRISYLIDCSALGSR